MLNFLPGVEIGPSSQIRRGGARSGYIPWPKGNTGASPSESMLLEGLIDHTSTRKGIEFIKCKAPSEYLKVAVGEW